jgi:hypothetical protein
MNEAADIATRAQRFNDTARTFTPPLPIRHAKLAPIKDGIVELRQKAPRCASFANCSPRSMGESERSCRRRLCR